MMSDVSKELVRIFFELNGFFVKKETRLLVKRIQVAGTRSGNFILSADDLNKVQQALVDVKGWHTEVFFPSVINSSPEIFTFLGEESLKEAERFFERKKFKKIIVVPKLPNVKETLKKSVSLLRQNGVDHAIEFPVILDYLIHHVRKNVNYVDNDLLQLIRIFKCYSFYRPPQLELFTPEKRSAVSSSRIREKDKNSQKTAKLSEDDKNISGRDTSSSA
jgi:hypothetical protein